MDKKAKLISFFIFLIAGVKLLADMVQVADFFKTSNNSEYNEKIIYVTVTPYITPSFEPNYVPIETSTPYQSVDELNLSGFWTVKIDWKSGFRYSGQVDLKKQSLSLYTGVLNLVATEDPKNISHSVTEDLELTINNNSLIFRCSNPIAEKNNGERIKYESDSFILDIGSDKNHFYGTGIDSSNDYGSITMTKN
jgi:hypothetical protein